MNINSLLGLKSILETGSSDEAINNTLQKISLFAECDLRSPSNVAFHRLDIVHCDFTGIGFEWDGKHYAVVWNIYPNMDAVLVIPTTSKIRQEYPDVFSVGIINGLPNKNTTLLISDITTVSKKRLSPVEYEHPKTGRVTPARIPQSWYDRIVEGIVVRTTNERSFSEQVMFAPIMGANMLTDLDLLFEWRFKPTKIKVTNNQLEYRLWNQDHWNSTPIINPKIIISKERRTELIKKLISSDKSERNRGISEYTSIY